MNLFVFLSYFLCLIDKRLRWLTLLEIMICWWWVTEISETAYKKQTETESDLKAFNRLLSFSDSTYSELLNHEIWILIDKNFMMLTYDNWEWYSIEVFIIILSEASCSALLINNLVMLISDDWEWYSERIFIIILSWVFFWILLSLSIQLL